MHMPIKYPCLTYFGTYTSVFHKNNKTVKIIFHITRPGMAPKKQMLI